MQDSSAGRNGRQWCRSRSQSLLHFALLRQKLYPRPKFNEVPFEKPNGIAAGDVTLCWDQTYERTVQQAMTFALLSSLPPQGFVCLCYVNLTPVRKLAEMRLISAPNAATLSTCLCGRSSLESVSKFAPRGHCDAVYPSSPENATGQTGIDWDFGSGDRAVARGLSQGTHPGVLGWRVWGTRAAEFPGRSGRRLHYAAKSWQERKRRVLIKTEVPAARKRTA